MNKYKQKNLRLFYQRLNLNTKLHKNKNKKWFHKMMINNHYRKKKITLIKMDKIVRQLYKNKNTWKNYTRKKN